MVAEPVRETRDPRRVVELRERARRQQSRSGDVPNHQEDRPREDQQVHQDFAESVHGQVVDVTVVIQKQAPPRIKRRPERVGERDSTSGLELDLRYSENAC